MLGGKHQRDFSFEMQGGEGVEENAEDDKKGLDDDDEIPEKMARGQDSPLGSAF